MIDTFLGIGNSFDPRLIFISFDPSGEWPWDFIDNLDGQIKPLQNKFLPLVDFVLSLRNDRFLLRIEEDIECPYWSQSMTIYRDIELKIIQGFLKDYEIEELNYYKNQNYYMNEYRNNELSLYFYPIAPGHQKPFSKILNRYVSLPDTPKEYYESQYSHRASLFTEYFKSILNNIFQPIIFVLLPNDESKRFYLLKWMEEMKLFNAPINLSGVAIPNQDCSVWIIPYPDSIDTVYDVLSKSIIEQFQLSNPKLLSKLKYFYNRY